MNPRLQHLIFIYRLCLSFSAPLLLRRPSRICEIYAERIVLYVAEERKEHVKNVL